MARVKINANAMNFGAAEIAYENSGIIESQLIRIIENTIDIDFLLQCKGI